MTGILVQSPKLAQPVLVIPNPPAPPYDGWQDFYDDAVPRFVKLTPSDYAFFVAPVTPPPAPFASPPSIWQSAAFVRSAFSVPV